MRVLELTASELSGAFLQLSVKLRAFRDGEVLELWQQHFDRDTLG